MCHQVAILLQRRLAYPTPPTNFNPSRDSLYNKQINKVLSCHNRSEHTTRRILYSFTQFPKILSQKKKDIHDSFYSTSIPSIQAQLCIGVLDHRLSIQWPCLQNTKVKPVIFPLTDSDEFLLLSNCFIKNHYVNYVRTCNFFHQTIIVQPFQEEPQSKLHSTSSPSGLPPSLNVRLLYTHRFTYLYI